MIWASLQKRRLRRQVWTLADGVSALGGRIKGTLGDIDPLNKVPLKRARSRVQKGYPLRGLPNTTPKA